MATFYTGVSGDLTFNSIPLQVTSWNATEEATEIETTTVADAGFYNFTTGKTKLSFSAEAQFDGAITYGSSPPCIASGKYAAFNLEVSSGGPAFTGNAYVISCDYTHDLDGVLKYSLKCVAAGSYTTPSVGS